TDEFSKVFDPALRVRRILLLQRPEIAGAIQNALEELADGQPVAVCYERADDSVEAIERLECPQRQTLFGKLLLQRLPQGNLPLARIFFERSQRRVADAPGRRVQDAREG